MAAQQHVAYVGQMYKSTISSPVSEVITHLTRILEAAFQNISSRKGRRKRGLMVLQQLCCDMEDMSGLSDDLEQT